MGSHSPRQSQGRGTADILTVWTERQEGWALAPRQHCMLSRQTRQTDRRGPRRSPASSEVNGAADGRPANAGGSLPTSSSVRVWELPPRKVRERCSPEELTEARTQPDPPHHGPGPPSSLGGLKSWQYVITSLLQYNSHTVKLTHLKCFQVSGLVCSELCDPYHTSVHFHHLKGNLVPTGSYSPPHPQMSF